MTLLLVEIIVLIAMSLLVIIKPRLCLYFFLVIYMVEKNGEYFYISDSILTLVANLNQYLILILGIRAISQLKIRYFKSKELIIVNRIIFCFVSWGCLSYFWSVYDITVKEELFRLFKFLVLTFAIYGNIDSVKTLKRVLFLWLFFIVIKSIYQIIIYFIVGEVLTMNPIGTIIPVLFLMAMKTKKMNIKLGFSLLLCLIFISFIIYPMRRSFLSILIIIIGTTYFYFSGKTLIYTVLLLAGLFFLVDRYAEDRFVFKTKQTQLAIKSFDSGWSGRNKLWVIGYEMFKSKPIIGHGYGSNRKIIASLSHRLGFPYMDSRMHNTYLKVLVELGIIGLTIYLGLLFMLSKIFFKCYLFNKSDNESLSIFFFGLFINWIAIIIISFFGYSGYLDKTFWINIGFGLAGMKILYHSQFVAQRSGIAISTQ